MSGVQIVEEIVRPRIIESDDGTVIREGEEVVLVVEVSEQGPPGPPGPSSDVVLEGYTHTQVSPSDTWTINHNLGRRPIVTLLTTGAVEFDGQLTHMSDNQVIASLAAAVAGTARCL